MIMTKKSILLLITIFCLTGCSERKTVKHITGQYTVIDVGSIAGKYQKVYCSDYFISIELIPLETNDNSIIGTRRLNNVVLVNDSLIFMISELHTGDFLYFPPQRNLLVFDRSGKFRNQIGSMGQGPGEFSGFMDFYLSSDNSTIFVEDFLSIFEYDFTGKFISSFRRPEKVQCAACKSIYLEDDLFLGFSGYSHSRGGNYFLFDRNGEIVKFFPDRFFLDTQISEVKLYGLNTFWIDKQLYIKDREINDTLYTIENLNLQPVCVFDFGKYAFHYEEINEEGKRKIKFIDHSETILRYFRISNIVGLSKYFFYDLGVPKSLPAPKSRPEIRIFGGNMMVNDYEVYGIYDRVKNTNIILDTDRLGQKGIINDINGGLSIVPRYYAGNDEIIDIWKAEDMKEMLTEEYFASQTIKDKEAHQKLKALLKNLREDDNPVVVIAKLK